ncbi:MAG: hypothetical protein LQ338_005994 [Usnochroma carphineum]|nr:MAG: hypothetical protein LQ338_005994 [Usnochroma carphineum]
MADSVAQRVIRRRREARTKQSTDNAFVLTAEDDGAEVRRLLTGKESRMGTANTKSYVKRVSESFNDWLLVSQVSVTRIRRKFHSAFVAPRFHYRILTLLASFLTLIFVAFIFRAVGMLRSNRYALDQTLLDHTAQLYATHISLPMLYAHILPALAFLRMFETKGRTARETALAVRYNSYPCAMTEEQSLNLASSLQLLAGSLDQLWNVSISVTIKLPDLAKDLHRLSDRPIGRLDEAIQLTRNRSHLQETLITANELFYLDQGWIPDVRGINSYGLKALEDYTVQLEKLLQRFLPSLESALSLLLAAHDRYAAVLTTLRDLKLSRCAEDLKQSLSEPTLLDVLDAKDEEEGKGEGGQSSGWAARLRGMLKLDTHHPSAPVSPNVVSVAAPVPKPPSLLLFLVPSCH